MSISLDGMFASNARVLTVRKAPKLNYFFPVAFAIIFSWLALPLLVPLLAYVAFKGGLVGPSRISN